MQYLRESRTVRELNHLYYANVTIIKSMQKRHVYNTALYDLHQTDND